MRGLSLIPKIRDVPTLFYQTPSMLRDVIKRKYRKTPWGTLAGGSLAILYIINPLDLVPDVLPMIGVVDDSVIFGVFLALLSRDVKKYVLWKESTDHANPLPQKK